MKQKAILIILLAVSLAALACSIQLTDPTPTQPEVPSQPERPTFTLPPDLPTFTEPAPHSLPTLTPMPPTNTPTPTDEPTSTWTIHPTITTTFTAEPCTPDSEYVSDITVADGELFLPGETFTKTWRIRNDGDCTWTTDYQWVQLENSGGMLNAVPDAVYVPAPVPPGSTLDISVNLLLSEFATDGSLYEARFQMMAPDGTLFGTHPFTLIYASGGSAICPIPYAGTLAYINAAAGYCFLYPNTFSIHAGGAAIFVNGPPTGSEMVAHVSISSEPAGGLTSIQYANDKIAAWQNPSYPPVTGTVTMDGETATWAEGLPGITGSRIYFVVHNNRGFVMTLQPVDSAHSAMTADAEAMWDIVEPSFRWIDP